MIVLRRSLIVLAAASTLVVDTAYPTLSASLTDEAMKFIDDKMVLAAFMSNAKRALEVCREAEQTATEYDRDSFYDGRIAECLAYAEMHLKNNQPACTHFSRALAGLEAVPVDHPRYSEVHEWLDWIRRDRAKLGC